MISRLLALVMTVPATVLGLVFAMLALEEVSDQTEDVRACVHSVNREARPRGTQRLPFPPTYLVIETDRNRQKFVHYLGSFQADDSVAERVRPGDCVQITVDQAALEGPAPEAASLHSLDDKIYRVVLAKRAL